MSKFVCYVLSPAYMVPLNVSTRVTPRLWLMGGDEETASWYRVQLSQRLNNPPVLFVSESDLRPFASGTFAPLGPVGLPPSLHLLTLQTRDSEGSTHMLRVQNVYARDEGGPVFLLLA